MNKNLIVLCSLLLFLVSALPSSGQTYGLGFIFVEPTGLTAKMWLSNRQALAGGLGWASQTGNPLLIQVDYLPPSLFLLSDANLKVNFYYGLGGRLIFNGEAEGGFRFPFGFDFLAQRAPLNFFFEIVPILLFSPEARLILKGAIGVRYVFKASSGRRL